MLSNYYLFGAYHVNGGISTMGMAEIITEIYILLVGYGEPAIMSGCSHPNYRAKRRKIEHLINFKKMKPGHRKKDVDSFT